MERDVGCLLEQHTWAVRMLDIQVNWWHKAFVPLNRETVTTPRDGAYVSIGRCLRRTNLLDSTPRLVGWRGTWNHNTHGLDKYQKKSRQTESLPA